jgi:hypothetical protein
MFDMELVGIGRSDSHLFLQLGETQAQLNEANTQAAESKVQLANALKKEKQLQVKLQVLCRSDTVLSMTSDRTGTFSNRACQVRKEA